VIWVTEDVGVDHFDAPGILHLSVVLLAILKPFNTPGHDVFLCEMRRSDAGSHGGWGWGN